MADPVRKEASPSLARNPALDTWIRVEPDGSVTLFTGKAELGQGICTAIARIGAEELDLPLDRVRVHTADTDAGPDEFYTVGSNSIEESGSAVRQAAAEARQVLLELASSRLGAPIGALEVEAGTIRVRGSDREVTYGELMGGRRFDRPVTGEAVLKPPESYRLVGRPGPRIDLPAKIRGGGFLHDLELPGLLHARVVRPPGYTARLLAVSEREAACLPGVVSIVRDGSFLAVVAEREEQAVRAAEALRADARWEEAQTLCGHDRVAGWLADAPSVDLPVVDGTPREEPVPPQEDPPNASATLEATYFRPYQMHASIGPSVAIAQLRDGRLTVWSHSQGVSVLRLAIARGLGLEPTAVRVLHVAGAGCYGHNGADDVAFDAALLAPHTSGRPVRVQWERADEHAWEPYGPAMRVTLRASLGGGGDLLAWSHDVWSPTHMGRPLPYRDRSEFVAGWHRAAALPRPEPRPRQEPEAGIHRNAEPAYAVGRRRIVKHLVRAPGLRTSSMRGLGAYANVFAIESFMDELAVEAGSDPLDFRLRHLADPRARAVLEAAADRAGWRRPGGDGNGQGLGFARYKNAKAYAAVVVEVRVDPDSGAVGLVRAVIAADAGQIVDPDGLTNQLEGGLLQAASWTLREEVRFDRTRVTSRDWEGYPILTFPEVPEIETVLIDRPRDPSLGAGEAAQGPGAGAIANAVFHATGARIRDLPLRPDRVRAARRR